MRRLLSALATLSICAAVLGGVPSPAAASTSASVSGAGSVEWQTVWRDDFNGPAGQGVNTEFWKYDLGQGVSVADDQPASGVVGHRRDRDDDELDGERAP